MRHKYTPRRAARRWLESAPPYVLDCIDNVCVADRYTVLLCGDLLCWPEGEARTIANTSIPYLAMSDSPSHPQGVSLWGELSPHRASAYRYVNGRRRVRWLDLPERVREHVIARCAPEGGSDNE